MLGNLCEKHVILNVAQSLHCRTRPSVRTILPAMQYLHEQLKTVLKELNKIDYHLGPVAICSGCKEEKLLTYITYSSDKGSVYQQCTCTGCGSVIDHNNKVIMSKVSTCFD